MAELTENEMNNLAMIFKSIKKSQGIAKYIDHIPDSISSKIDKVPTLDEHMIAVGVQSADLNQVIRNLRKAYRTVQFDYGRGSSSRRRSRYGYYNTAYKTKIKSIGAFGVAWKNLVKANRHIEALEFMSHKPKKNKPAQFQIQGCISVWICKHMCGNNKVDDAFLDFVIEGNGKKYFNVPAKKVLVNYLHAQGRLDDMYRFNGAGSKTINDMVIRLARVEDLPFLMNTDGYTANQRLEKRIDKVK